MKRDPLAIALISVLLLGTFATAGMCYWYLYSARTHRAMQNRVTFNNQNRQLVQPLAVDLNAYARQNTNLLPLLEKMNLRLRAGAATNTPKTQP